MTNLSGLNASPRSLRRQQDMTPEKLPSQLSVSADGLAKKAIPAPQPSLPLVSRSSTHHASSSEHRTGRWSLDEKLLFLYGLSKFGKGRWKKISVYLPNRSLVQIKSHAQKVLKRQLAGENVFERLHEHAARLSSLVTALHAQIGLEPPRELTHGILTATTTTEHRQGLGEWPTALPQDDGAAAASTDHAILAASALCQLASPAAKTTPSSTVQPTKKTRPSHGFYDEHTMISP